MDCSPDNIRRLFTSSGGSPRSPRESYIRLSYCIRHDLIQVHPILYRRAIPPKDVRSEEYRDYKKILYSRRNENLDHRYLKWDAYIWCLKETRHLPAIESVQF
jgi:hypothetical protein